MLLRVGLAEHHLACDEVICSGTQKTRLEEKWLPWTFLATRSHFLSHTALMEPGGTLVNEALTICRVLRTILAVESAG